MERKNGPRIHGLPGVLPPDLPPKVKFKLEKFRHTHIDNSNRCVAQAPGPDGYRYEYLYALAAGMACNLSQEAVRLHKEFAEGFVNAEWPAWYYWLV